MFLLTLAPSDGSAATLAKGKASHTLLQRRSAPRKVVRLLPDKRGRLFNVNHLIVFAFSYIKNINSFFLSRSLPPKSEGSAEPARR